MHAGSWASRRVLVLLPLGFAAGVPFHLQRDSMQAWLKDAGVDLTTIGLLFVVTLPSAFQVLWAPFMDRYAPRLARLGRRRAWLVLTQVALILAIGTMAALGPAIGTSRFSVDLFMYAALLVGFLSASQDIVVNAYRTDVLPEEERSKGVATYVAGFRLAMIGTGAGVMYLADRIGWQSAYLLAAASMVLGLVATLFAPEPPESRDHPATLSEAVLAPLEAFLSNPLGPIVLLFVILFKLPDYFASAMTVPFLKTIGYTNEEIAVVRQTLGLAITIAGTFAGAAIVARIGLFAFLVIAGLVQAASNAGFLLLALGSATTKSLVLVVGFESFCTGLVTAGFVAFLMACCTRRYSATQYALLASLMNVGATGAGMASGAMAEGWGFDRYFLFTIAAAIPGLVLLPFVRGAAAGRLAQEHSDAPQS